MPTLPPARDFGSPDEARPGDLRPPNWKELAPLLDALLDAPAEERTARIVELSQGNPTRQRELEQLLAEAEQSTPLLDRRAADRFRELATDDPDQSLPQLLADRYRIGKELGRGGMARVYLARDLKHDRDVAIKVIKSELSASLGHERFLREIEIAARLRHANIVPLYDSGRVPAPAGGTEGSLFFVMPHEEGQSLRQRLRESGALPVGEAVSVLRDVARALGYAHAHGVVHRDIKPDNVMLSGGAAVVTDFGIAKAVSAALTDAPDATLTQAGTVIGTPAYMAPEQATGAAVDHRADIYSFGCLGYELFAGHPPFQGESGHLLIAAHIATPPRPVVELRPDVPPPVAELLSRCLAKAPADRPQSARELLAILDEATGASAVPSSATRDPAARRSSGMRRRWVAVTAILAVAAIGGYVATRTASTKGPLTVAVLPFANIAGDSAMDFVADGLADEVASAIARVPGILVKSRMGARAYRGQLTPNVTEAGVKLKADYLLTTVVRQERGVWILKPELERAADATSLWDDRFVVDPNEQAAVADSIVGRLAAALRRRFPRAIGVAPARAPSQRTDNNEAYRLYLRGQEKLARRGVSVKEAVTLFREAIQQDSLFAPAYSGLSMALALMPWFHQVPSTVVHDSVVTAARQALGLDPTLALPHVALGLAHRQAYDWGRAEAQLDTAVRLDPRNVEARVQYAWIFLGSGRFNEALAQYRAARLIDPASALVLSHITFAYLGIGQMDSALAESRRALETDSTNSTTLVAAAMVSLATRKLQDTRAVAVRFPEFYPHRGYYLAMSGDTATARELLRRLDARPPAWGDQTKRAFTYLGLGDTTNALSALERATDAKELWPIYPSVTDRMFDPIRKSARFRRLLERVGLGAYTSNLTR